MPASSPLSCPASLRLSSCRTLCDVLLLAAPLCALWCGFADLGGFPGNDDPFYGRTAEAVAREQRLVIFRQHGELTASAVLHSVLGGLFCSAFGFSYRTLFACVLLQLWVSGAALYWVARTTDCRRSVALLISLTYLCTPLVAGHGFTFMTDAPAMAWFCLAIVSFHAALQQESFVGWLPAAAATVAAFWIRQTHAVAILFPAATQLLLWHRSRQPLRIPAGLWSAPATLLLGVALFESEVITHSNLQRLDDTGSTALTLERLREIAVAVYGLGLLLGLILLPLAPLLLSLTIRQLRSSDRSCRRIMLASILATGGCLLTPFLLTRGRACLTSATGTFLQNAHFGPIFLSDAYEHQRWDDMGGVAWPMIVWQLLSCCAVVVCGLLVGQAVQCLLQWRDAHTPGVRQRWCAEGLGLLCLVPVFVLSLLILISGILDRYWMPLLPVVLLGLILTAGRSLSQCGRLARYSSAALVASSLLMTTVFLHDWLLWNRTRWLQAQQWLAEGRTPQEFDGGRDMNAWFRAREDSQTFPRRGDPSAWWSGHARLALASQPRDGWRVIDRLSWASWATLSDHQILVLQRRRPRPSVQLDRLTHQPDFPVDPAVRYRKSGADVAGRTGIERSAATQYAGL